MTHPGFERIGIYGVGLLGGSLGLALKHAFPEAERIGIGRNSERLQNAMNRGAIDRLTTDPATLEHSLDALVLCTPVRDVARHFEAVRPALAPHAIVTDVGSTKTVLVAECERVAGSEYRFVGSHPMAGSHKTGVDAARDDLFRDRLCIITPTPDTDPDAQTWVSDLWKALGMNLMLLSPEEHDRIAAYTSHMPHLVAAALCHTVQGQGERIRHVIGSGFQDTTRIAAGDPGLWVDICMDNQEELLRALEVFQRDVDAIRNAIREGNADEVQRFLQAAKSWKDSLS